MTAWVIRAGRHGQQEQTALEQGLAGVVFPEVPDLTNVSTKEQVRAAVDAASPSASLARRANLAGQLWALRGVVAPGDLIVMPQKGRPWLAIGECTAGYWFRDTMDADVRHVVSVEWKNIDIPRSAVKADLLNTLNGAMTVFQASRHDAEARLRALLERGIDPGSDKPTDAIARSEPGVSDDNVDEREVVDPPSLPTLEAIRDRVRRHLIENFKGHDLTDLVATILRVHGYTCDVSPPGPDHGVDIVAGSGPLGLDAPTLIVEVKSEENAVGSPVVRGLSGAVARHDADQGLLVAWGGLNRAAREEIATQRLRLRVWESDHVLDNLFQTYDRLPDRIRQAIPLERVWVLDAENG